MPGSQLVINHRVAMCGSAQHAAISGTRVLYIANREGAVVLKTDDDLRIESENTHMATLGYLAYRPGSVPEPNAGHALFDACGIPERARIRRELRETSSAIITSVVSVRREDAPALGLETKQDWERLLRSQWTKYVEGLQIMQVQDVRWVAAFHVNQENNLHVHVLAWDASGRLNSLLPRRRIAEANDALRAHVLRPQREALSLERTQARDELVARIRGMELEQGALASLRASLPAEGSLKHANLARRCPGAAKAIDDAVGRIVASDPELRFLQERYEQAALGHARLKGLAGDALVAHSNAAESDLRRRLGNALIANVLGRSPSLRAPADNGRRLAPEGEAFLSTPRARKRVVAISEELSSCLTAKERVVLASAVAQSARTGAPLAKKPLSIARKAPAVRTAVGADALASAVIANMAGVCVLARRAVGGEGGDAGEEALRGCARSIAAVLSFAIRCARMKGAPPASKLRQFNVHKPKLGGLIA